MTEGLTPEDLADLASAEAAPNTDDYDPAELRRAVLRIADRRAAAERAARGVDLCANLQKSLTDEKIRAAEARADKAEHERALAEARYKKAETDARWARKQLSREQATRKKAEARASALEAVTPEQVAEWQGLMPDDGIIWEERCETAAAVLCTLREMAEEAR